MHCACPLLGVKRTWPVAVQMSAYDPKRTLASHTPDPFQGRNIQMDVRFTAGDTNQARNYAAELIKSGPDVILANTAPVVIA